MKNKKIITAFLAITFSLLSLLTPLACVSSKMDQATTYQESNRKESQRRMSYSGTAVPNSGIIERIYFNSNLSVEEVVTIIENANLTFIEGLYPIVIFEGSDDPESASKYFNMGIMYFEGAYVISLIENAETIFVSQSIEGFTAGWQEPLTNTLNNATFNLTAVSEYKGLSIGAQNEALSSLISITPFEEETPPTLIKTIGTGIANSALLFGAVLTNAFTALASVFITNNVLTLLGTVLVIAIGATVVSFAIKLILRLIQKIKV